MGVKDKNACALRLWCTVKAPAGKNKPVALQQCFYGPSVALGHNHHSLIHRFIIDTLSYCVVSFEFDISGLNCIQCLMSNRMLLGYD